MWRRRETDMFFNGVILEAAYYNSHLTMGRKVLQGVLLAS